MNGEVQLEAPRPRPLSGGLWTLFSWLRRDERSSSSDSLSSVGSARTAASFDFLAPAHYRVSAPPLVLPPPGPPTDSYKKRVRDRNIRRQHDRDITLHRKYGLYRAEGFNYDAFSLPPARKNNTDANGGRDRERRATSECVQRRVVYVPGKRRAPQPPGRIFSAAPTVQRQYSRKRPAPQPPVNILKTTKEDIKNTELEKKNNKPQMNSQSLHEKEPNDVTMGCKSEKYSKKESKPRSERSFLKQIFESKKRNSAIDTSSVKVLPSISELDKQAAEIIENCKLKALEQNNNVSGSWFCTKCLRKYNASVIVCLYCLSDQKRNPTEGTKDCDKIFNPSKASNTCTQTENVGSVASSSKNRDIEDKQKLKEMLKEMKDSLPKRPKHSNGDVDKNKKVTEIKNKGSPPPLETPTLRIGSTMEKSILEMQTTSNIQSAKVRPVSSSSLNPTVKPLTAAQVALVTQHVVLAHAPHSNNDKMIEKQLSPSFNPPANKEENRLQSQLRTNLNIISVEKKKLDTPLKISSLLNPVYVPKNVSAKERFLNTPQNASSNSPIATAVGIDVGVNTTAKLVLPSPSHSSGLPSSPQASSTPLGSSNVDKFVQQTSKSSVTKILPGKSAIESVNKPLSNEVKSPEASMKEQKKLLNRLIPSCSDNTRTTSQNVSKPIDSIVERLDQHSRRRDLINQLEKSIAKGDERSAADAAAKLAQLRLSCSVLSFSSQIMSEPSTSTQQLLINKNIPPNTSNNAEKSPAKVNGKDQTASFVPSGERPEQTKVPSNVKSVSAIKEKTVTSPVLKSGNPSKEDFVTTFPQNLVTKNPVCQPSTSKNNSNIQGDIVSVAVWVEDKEAVRGPIHLRIPRNAVMMDLRREAETSLGLASRLQRWIVGRTLCTDDNIPLETLAQPNFSAPFYLCLVESDKNTVENDKTTDTNNEKQDQSNVYTELVQLEQQALVSNPEIFECEVCMDECAPGGGAVLRECVHMFCRNCLSDVVRHCEEPVVSCPATGCPGILQEREIRALVTDEDYERWLARGLAAAESGTRNAFHCRTRDCTGWALCEPGVRQFPCPVCKKTNCVLCQAIHESETCEQHRAKLQEAVKTTDASQTDEGTQALLNTLIKKGEALECPECSAIITKKWGCDWVKCSACKTEICWVTRGRRWGPGGKGDTSGGCRCGVDGKRCHPSCGYCH